MPKAKDARADKAFELYRQGLKLIEIAGQLQVAEGTVRSWKNRYKWDDESNATLRKKECNVAKPIRTQKTAKNSKSEPEVEQILQNGELTDKQRLFCVYYVRCFNATKAYQKAYDTDYKTAAANAYRLMENDGVKREIDRLKKERLNREFLSEADIFQKYVDIAFADLTDYLEFGTEEVPVIGQFGPVKVKDEKTGKEKVLMQRENRVYLKDSAMVDGSLVTELTTGRNGTNIRLADRMKALQWLSDHVSHEVEETADDGFLEALKGSAAEDWSDEEE